MRSCALPVGSCGARAAVPTSALENLRAIRETLERSSSFTALPGLSGVWIGLTALAAAYVAASTSTREAWLSVWLGEAAIGVVIGGVSTARKIRAAGLPILTGAARRFFVNLAAPLTSGAVLTIVVLRAERPELIPGVWLLLYGAACVNAAAVSLRILAYMGGIFMALGVAAFAAPNASDALLAAGFGGLHVVFGAMLARRSPCA